MIEIPDSRSAIGAISAIGSARPSPEREADRNSRDRLADGKHDSRERKDTEREHEGREAKPQENAVEAGGERHRHHAPPVLGKLSPQLRQDRHAAQLGACCHQRQCRGSDVRDSLVRPLNHAAEGSQQTERHYAPGQRADCECDASGEGRWAAAVVTGRTNRLDHRKATRRPGSGEAGEQGGDGEDDLEPAHQQGTFVS